MFRLLHALIMYRKMKIEKATILEIFYKTAPRLVRVPSVCVAVAVACSPVQAHFTIPFQNRHI